MARFSLFSTFELSSLKLIKVFRIIKYKKNSIKNKMIIYCNFLCLDLNTIVVWGGAIFPKPFVDMATFPLAVNNEFVWFVSVEFACRGEFCEELWTKTFFNGDSFKLKLRILGLVLVSINLRELEPPKFSLSFDFLYLKDS